MKTSQSQRENEKLHYIFSVVIEFLFLHYLKKIFDLYLIEVGSFPSTSYSTTLSSLNNNLLMSTTTKNISTNSFGFPSSRSSTPQTTCHLCQRLLYSFEEILVC